MNLPVDELDNDPIGDDRLPVQVGTLPVKTWTPEELERTNRECPFGDGYISDEQFDDAYHEMTSWVHGPKKDGSTYRNYTGRMAHKECIERAAAGIAPDQASLFDQADEQPA